MRTMATFFTSDTHFGHQAIIRFSRRPYQTAKEMNEDLVKRWNSRISSGDTVYHLGDLGFHSEPEELNPILEQLNGKIIVIQGNHDRDPDLQSFAYWRIYEFHDFLERPIDGQHITFCHYPLMEWDHSFRGSWMLHGHSHNQWPQTKYKRLDVGVDGHDMYPWSFDEIREVMSKRVNHDSSIYR